MPTRDRRPVTARMRVLSAAGITAALFVVTCVRAHAQSATPYTIQSGDSRSVPIATGADPDFRYHVHAGKVEYRSGDIRVRADRIVVVDDRDEEGRAIEEASGSGKFPRRGIRPPISQGDLLARRVRQRFEERMGKLASFDIPPGRDSFAPLTRALLAEGNVVFERAGVRVVRCERLWLSMVSDRAFMEGVTVRLPVNSPFAPSGAGLVLRAPRVVQQGPVMVARGASLTSCEAGEAHFDIRSERLVVTQRGDVVEVLGQGNAVQAGVLPALPLPDYRWFSDQENWVPLQGLSAGVSNDRGEFVIAEFGGRWNDLGQKIVDFFGSKSPERFRGDWRLRTGWTRRRGLPFDGRLQYRLPESFDGWTEGFFLRDHAQDRRSVLQRLDGSPITERRRAFVRSRNRFAIRDGLRLDVEGFWAGDAAAYAEFRDVQLKDFEQPETSLELRDLDENRLLTATGRFNLVDWVYSDTAQLTDRFRSERPYLRASLFSEVLTEIVEDVPLVVDVSLGAGSLRNRYSDRSASRRRERALRADLEVEISTPTTLGPFAVRPWLQARETLYSERVASGSASSRTSLAAGITVDTRLTRHFDVNSEALGIRGLMHDVRPALHVFHRFDVDREPGDFYQFDEIDALDEVAALDLVLFQRLLTRRTDRRGASVADTLVWLDLTQRLYPIDGRDNAGDRLGVFAWELIVTPGFAWLPLPNLRLLFEGERDWNRNEFKTRNVGFATSIDEGPIFAAEWRSGADGDGTGAATLQVPAYRRWSLLGNVIWNFERDAIDSTTLQIVRHDHDWDWEFRFVKNELTNDTSVALRFRPTLGGLVRRRMNRYPAGSPAFGVLETPTNDRSRAANGAAGGGF